VLAASADDCLPLLGIQPGASLGRLRVTLGQFFTDQAYDPESLSTVFTNGQGRPGTAVRPMSVRASRVIRLCSSPAQLKTAQPFSNRRGNIEAGWVSFRRLTRDSPDSPNTRILQPLSRRTRVSWFGFRRREPRGVAHRG
jgi:hypothetical protein